MRDATVIAVTGPDGSGKSTLCARLKEELGRSVWGAGTVAQVSVWDAMASSGLFTGKEAVGKYFQDLEGPTRTLFIYHALSRSMDLAVRAGANVLLVEGYWYKYAVTEIAYGVDRGYVEAAASAFPKPLLTIRLDVGTEESWERKRAATPYEQGALGPAQGENERERYVSFQRRLRPIWESIERDHGPWERVAAGTRPEEALAFSLERCQSVLRAEGRR